MRSLFIFFSSVQQSLMEVALLLSHKDLALAIDIKPRLVLVVLELHELLGELQLNVSCTSPFLNGYDFLVHVLPLLVAPDPDDLLSPNCELSAHKQVILIGGEELVVGTKQGALALLPHGLELLHPPHRLAHPVQLLVLVQLDEPVKTGLKRHLAATTFPSNSHCHHDLFRVWTFPISMWSPKDELSVVHGLHVAVVGELDCNWACHFVIFFTSPPSSIFDAVLFEILLAPFDIFILPSSILMLPFLALLMLLVFLHLLSFQPKASCLHLGELFVHGSLLLMQQSLGTFGRLSCRSESSNKS